MWNLAGKSELREERLKHNAKLETLGKETDAKSVTQG